MCGIIGFVDKKSTLNETQQQGILDRMLGRLAHRGPDDSGTYLYKTVGIGHSRLSIVDVSSLGKQPMFDDQKKLVLSFNGEIYNHAQLRRELGGKYRFVSQSDTETLLYALREWGEQCLIRAKGMFAFSLLDTEKGSIFFAVDRFSIKPLYYINTSNWFAWSSEVKSFLELPGFASELSHKKLGEYLLFRSVADSETLFSGVHKALPGQFFSYSLASGILDVEQYWTPHTAASPLGENHVADICILLDRSVQEHLMSDVPLGVQLSGGVDSGIIDALVRNNISEHQELHSFSVGLENPLWNEFRYSRELSKLFKTTHHELLFTEHDFCAKLPLATYHLDEPVNHSHTIPMMMLAEHASQYVKVLLSGEGADELFGGYGRYKALTVEGMPTPDAIIASNAFTKKEDITAVLTGEISFDLSYRKQILDSVRDASTLYQIAWYDLQTYLPPLLLRQDKVGMKSSLENRVPFLDHELALGALHLEDSEKIAGGETKALLKKVAEQFLPHDIIYRTKVGFGQPISEWLRNKNGLGAYLRFFRKPLFPRQFLNYREIEAVIDAHQSGAIDSGAVLWVLVNLEIWMQIFIDGVPPELVWENAKKLI